MNDVEEGGGISRDLHCQSTVASSALPLKHMRRALEGEHFLRGEHFEESTFEGESTLRRALFERRALGGEHFSVRRALWGEHILKGEHFEESTSRRGEHSEEGTYLREMEIPMGRAYFLTEST